LKSTYVRNWEKAHGQSLPNGYKVHHIIPQDVIDQAKKVCPQFKIHDADNLIALPGRAGVTPHTGPGFGTTEHFGSHPGYNQAVETALKAARRLKIPGMNGCMKIRAIQEMLKKSLSSGQNKLNNGKGSTPIIRGNWQDYLRNEIKGP
jgi:hypothetical protein